MNRQTFNNKDQNLVYLSEYFPGAKVSIPDCVYSGLAGYVLYMTGEHGIFTVREAPLSDDLFNGTIKECVNFIQYSINSNYVQ